MRNCLPNVLQRALLFHTDLIALALAFALASAGAPALAEDDV